MKIQLSKFRTVMLVVALFLLNIVEQAASAISATIPGMAASFPHVSETNIELVTTAVNLTITVFVLVSGLVTTRIGQKRTAVAGIAIAAVSSIVPAFATTYGLILASRFLLGVGIGLANPLAISLIGEFFKDDAVAQLMGWRSAVASVGNTVMTFVASQLVTINWHTSYLVYLLFVPVLILFVIFVPSTDTKKVDKAAVAATTDNAEDEGSAYQGLGTAIVLMLFVLLMMGISMISYIKMALWFVQTGIGSPAAAGTILSLLGISMMVGSALFGTFYKFLRAWILPIGTAVAGGIGVVMTFLHSVPLIGALALLASLFGCMGIPYIFTRIVQISSKKSAPLNTAVILVGTNLGSFLSVYIAAVLGHTAVETLRNGNLVLILLAAIVAVVFIVTKQGKSHKKEEITAKGQHVGA